MPSTKTRWVLARRKTTSRIVIKLIERPCGVVEELAMRVLDLVSHKGEERTKALVSRSVVHPCRFTAKGQSFL